MKIKATALAEELGVDIEPLLTLINERVKSSCVTGKGKNTWLTEEGVDIITLALEVPAAAPRVYKARVKGNANNPNYVMAIIEGIEGKHPVAIRRRHRDRFLGKTIEVHAITDDRGTTYRHADLTGHNY
jgi:hypothetical protein